MRLDDDRGSAARSDGRVSDALRDELSGLVETERERFGVPGCAVLVVHDGEVVLRAGFGSRDLAKDLPVRTSTLFPIGSSTKTFTAALCALAVDEGLIGWDAPIADHLPGFALQDPVATRELTLRDMLAHRSGLPRHDLLWYAASDGSLTRDDLISALRHLPANRGFRQAWQYNNLVFTTAGELAGRLFGSSYEDAVRTHLLKPLGMSRTGFSVSESQHDPDAARPYVVDPDGGEPVEVPFASLDLVGPAGNINSTVEDLTGWLLDLLGRPQGEPVLSATALELLRTPVMPLSEVSPLTIGRSVGYAAGLAVDDYRGFRVLHHGGNIDGFSSQVSLIPETGSGVVVLTNRSSTGLRDALPYVLYDRLLGLDPQPHGEHVVGVEQLLRAGMKASAEGRTTRRPDSPAVRPLADYVGSYTHPGYGTVEVLAGDGEELPVRYRAVTATLRHRHLEVFDLHAELGGEDVHIPAQFFHDSDGEVAALTAVLEPTVPPIRFDRQPDTAHLTDEVLTGLTGTYALGPISLVVTRRGEKDLVVSVAGGAPRLVTAKGGWRFAVDALTVEFVPPDTVRTPYGDFTRG